MKTNLHSFLDTNTFLMTNILAKMRKVNIELMRVSELAAVLLDCGLQKEDKEILSVYSEIEKTRNKTCELKNISEIIYCLQFLPYFPKEKENVNEIIMWLLSHRNEDGGFGRFVGDRSRIPVCWRALESFYLNGWRLDENLKSTILWMQNEWSKDVGLGGGLSYKCSGILIANSYYSAFKEEFINDTIKWLIADQNSDGGWSARKNSPVGSVPSYTFLALRALSHYQNMEGVKKTLQKGIKWLIKNRLKSGFWKEHPPEIPLMHSSIFLNNYLKNETKFH